MATNAQPPRKKSCSTCSKAKVRCDLRRPQCTRCRNRALDCVYVEANGGDEWLASAREANVTDRSYLDNEGELNFKRIELIRVVDEHKVRARWLESLLPSVDQRPKPYTAPTMKFVSHVLNSYPAMFTEDSSPPLIHWSQMKVLKSKFLVECANTCRRWIEQSTSTMNMMNATSICSSMDEIYHQVSGQFANMIVSSF